MGVVGDDNTVKAISRFSRLPKGQVLGALVRGVLKKRPRLRILQRKNTTKFEFSFEGSVPATLRNKYPRLYEALFKPKGVHWTKVLLQAYSEPLAGKGKPIKHWLSFWLHKLFVNALATLLNDVKDAGEKYEGPVNREIESLRRSLRQKPGPRTSRSRQDRDAIRLARRHQILRPEVDELKRFIRSQNIGDHKALSEAAQKALQYKWLHHVTRGEALKNLPTINNDPATGRSRLSGRWAPWQLSVGVIHCEEKGLNPRTRRGPDTIFRYILRGYKLLKKNNSGVKAP